MFELTDFFTLQPAINWSCTAKQSRDLL